MLHEDDPQELINLFEGKLKDINYKIRNLNVYQREILEQILDQIRQGNQVKGVVQMPTGTGKTFLATSLTLILYRHNKTKSKYFSALFLAPRIIIKSQAYKSYRRLFERFEIEDIFYEKVRSKAESTHLCDIFSSTVSKIFVATPQLLDRIYNENPQCFNTIVSTCNVIFLDEAHTIFVGKYISRCIKELLKGKNLLVAIGLTATPVKEIEEEFGLRILFNKYSYDAMKKGLLTRDLLIRRYRTEIRNVVPKNSLIKYKDEWQLAIRERAKEYAKKIYYEILHLRNKLRDRGVYRIPKTLVVAANTLEANNIGDHLRELDNSGELDVITAHYRADKAIDKIKEFTENRRSAAVLITVNMADIGFDDKELELLAIARPIKNPVSYVQIRGRVLRRAENKENAKNVLGYATIVDLTGEAIHEKSVKSVEEGAINKRELNAAFNELRGVDEVPEAYADIKVRFEKENFISKKSMTHFSDKEICERFKVSKKLEYIIIEGRYGNLALNMSNVPKGLFQGIRSRIDKLVRFDLDRDNIKLNASDVEKIVRYIIKKIMKVN